MKALEAYQQATITTQSRGRLVVILYDGAASSFSNWPSRNWRPKTMRPKGITSTAPQDIISELNAVLDMEAGGELTRNLRSLYLFMNRHLGRANAKRDPNA